MSGLDEQNGIECPNCRFRGSFVYLDSDYKLALHIHGDRLYITSTEDTLKTCSMLKVPINTAPRKTLKNMFWTDMISRSRNDKDNGWICKNCSSLVLELFMARAELEIYKFIGTYYFDEMIFIGKKDCFDSLGGYSRRVNDVRT